MTEDEARYIVTHALSRFEKVLRAEVIEPEDSQWRVWDDLIQAMVNSETTGDYLRRIEKRGKNDSDSL